MMDVVSPLQLKLFDEPSAGVTAPRSQLSAMASDLAYRVSAILSVPVRLFVTDNRTTMVSFRRGAKGLRLRVHHMFLEAPDEVVRALALYAGRGTASAGQLLDEFIQVRQPLIRKRRTLSEPELSPQGRCFHLQEIFEKLNAQHFGGAISARIAWGRMPGSKRRRSIRLGVYDPQGKEIRIHPALDRPYVPRFFVEFIVFHEMLHELFPASVGRGRRVHHPRKFRERERDFPLYDQALAWERENLRRLLRQ
jgi:hypothetical protein